jgi:biotin carboxyl carrier protein
MKIRIDEKEFSVSIAPHEKGYAVNVGGRRIITEKKGGKLHAGNHTLSTIRKNTYGGYMATVDNEGYTAEFADAAQGFGKHITAPMNGTILSVDVKDGQRVRKGQTVIRMLSMKMENEIKAESSCRIKKILAKPGQAVAKDDKIAEIDKDG